ncbi:MAG: CDP-glycerol glycerophosphotransferase family protein [Brevinema sp.]
MMSTWSDINGSSLVVFSEGGMYRFTNTPLVRALAEKTSVSYITLDPKDPLLAESIPNVKILLVKPNFHTWFQLSRLKADLFITTTPGLNSLALKRSPHVKHYSYYMHSPADLHWYQRYSFDSFDSICLSTTFQGSTLDAIEKTRIYGFSYLKEQRHVIGLPYYDHYVAEFDRTEAQQGNKPSVLIATNWGGNNYLNYMKYDLFDKFLSEGYEVIFRPHPQSFKADAKLINGICQKYQSHPDFTLDRDINFMPSLKRADVMVSSISGIVFDYAFLTEKPFIIVDFERDTSKYAAFEGDFLTEKPWEDRVLYQEAGLVLSVDDENIVQKASAIDKDKVKKNIQNHKQMIPNFGSTIPKLVDHYLALLERLNA